MGIALECDLPWRRKKLKTNSMKNFMRYFMSGQRVVKIPVVVNRPVSIRLGSVLMTLASSEYIDGERDDMLQGDSTR